MKGRSLYHNLTGGATLPTMLLGQSVTFALDRRAAERRKSATALLQRRDARG
ncbi:MAG: hypothetical protein U0521_20505 [Anaerolineae bacterium]